MAKPAMAIGNGRLAIAVILVLFCLVMAPVVHAAQGQVLLNGRVKSIDLSTNTVVVTDYEGKDFSLYIEDEDILAKFRDGRIKAGDDVNVKYRVKEGKNVPFSFRKLAGC
jgi:hypothetical protein